MKLYGYSTLTEDVLELGTPDTEDVLELGSMAAEGHDNLIVFTDKPVRLQKWEAT